MNAKKVLRNCHLRDSSDNEKLETCINLIKLAQQKVSNCAITSTFPRHGKAYPLQCPLVEAEDEEDHSIESIILHKKRQFFIDSASGALPFPLASQIVGAGRFLVALFLAVCS